MKLSVTRANRDRQRERDKDRKEQRIKDETSGNEIKRIKRANKLKEKLREEKGL